MAGLPAARQDATALSELGMIRTTVNCLFALMRDRFEGFPSDYLAFDVETTGFKVGEDLVAELGYVLVRGSRPVDRGWVFLDWTRDPGVDQGWLRERIEQTRRHVETKNGQPTGRTYHVNYDRLRDGMDPREALRRYERLFLDNRDAGHFCVAHNGYHFDARFIEYHLRNLVGSDFRFGDYELFDTGVVEKGSQGAMTPWAGETLRDFSARVSRTWLKGVYWSMDHCAPKYGLAERLGLRSAEIHDAAVDSLLTHALFEEFRSRAVSGGPDSVPREPRRSS